MRGSFHQDGGHRPPSRGLRGWSFPFAVSRLGQNTLVKTVPTAASSLGPSGATRGLIPAGSFLRPGTFLGVHFQHGPRIVGHRLPCGGRKTLSSPCFVQRRRLCPPQDGRAGLGSQRGFLSTGRPPGRGDQEDSPGAPQAAAGGPTQ